MTSQVLPSKAEKELALAEVLESQSFARSEQLKNFLRFVCELEISGRAAEIKEYSIGIVALGRSLKAILRPTTLPCGGEPLSFAPNSRNCTRPN